MTAHAVDLEISDEQRRMVRAMAGFGVRADAIAGYLGVQTEILHAAFGTELEKAAIEANAKVAQSLFNMATKQNNVAAAIFWMKARGGGREKQELVHGTDPNDPLKVIIVKYAWGDGSSADCVSAPSTTPRLPPPGECG